MENFNALIKITVQGIPANICVSLTNFFGVIFLNITFLTALITLFPEQQLAVFHPILHALHQMTVSTLTI